MWILLAGIIILILIAVIWSLTQEHFDDSAHVHDFCVQAHITHPWLDNYHGGFSSATQNNNGQIFEYTSQMWSDHCQILHFSPYVPGPLSTDQLLATHSMYFPLGYDAASDGGPDYHMKDGSVQQLTKEMIEMEADWFTKNSPTLPDMSA